MAGRQPDLPGHGGQLARRAAGCIVQMCEKLSKVLPGGSRGEQGRQRGDGVHAGGTSLMQAGEYWPCLHARC